jgi:hypothetical protein
MPAATTSAIAASAVTAATLKTDQVLQTVCLTLSLVLSLFKCFVIAQVKH